jgi:hypothetical protein
MLQPRMRIFLLYTGCLLEAVHDVSKNPGSHKADFSRNTAIRESGLSAAIRCVIILRLLCGQTSLMHLQRVLTQKMFACAARLLP